MVIAVAGDTGFAFYLAGGMVSGIPFDPDFHLVMTDQTLVVGHLVSQGMALGTVGKAFQMGVNFSQIAGRELGKEKVGSTAKEYPTQGSPNQNPEEVIDSELSTISSHGIKQLLRIFS